MTATASNNLGMLLKTTSRYEEALGHYEESLRTRVNVLGDGHPDTIISMNNMAELLIASGQPDKVLTSSSSLLSSSLSL